MFLKVYWDIRNRILWPKNFSFDQLRGSPVGHTCIRRNPWRCCQGCQNFFSKSYMSGTIATETPRVYLKFKIFARTSPTIFFDITHHHHRATSPDLGCTCPARSVLLRPQLGSAGQPNELEDLHLLLAKMGRLLLEEVSVQRQVYLPG